MFKINVTVNVSLDDILCIAEPFVNKPIMVRHHYKPEHHMRKMGFYLQGQGHISWISVHTIKYDLLIWLGDQLSLTVHIHKLVKRLLDYFWLSNIPF